MSVTLVTVASVHVTPFGEYDPPHRGNWRFNLEPIETSSDGIEALCTLPLDPDWAVEHFGIVPAVLYIEIAAQLLLRFAAMFCTTEELKDLKPVMAAVDEWRFKKEAYPGDKLTVRITKGKAKRRFWFASASIHAENGQMLACGKLAGGLVSR
jgi:acyl-CoA thioesterase FadM